MTIKCVDCGKFIPYADIQAGLASFHHEPSSLRGREVNEWTCHACVIEEILRHEEFLATAGVWDR